MREAMSNAVHPFLAWIVTSAPFSIRYNATGLFLETKDYLLKSKTAGTLIRILK